MKEIARKAGLEGLCHPIIPSWNMFRTGHRSEVAVRKYKRSNSALQDRVSKVLNPPNVKKMKWVTTMVEMSESENNRKENFNPQSDSKVTRGAVPKSVFNEWLCEQGKQ